jgi:hypothetical protein
MFSNLLKTTQDFLKIWIVLLSVVAIVLLTVGLALITLDRAIVNGGLYIITSLSFGMVAFIISKERIVTNLLNPLFSLGFILSIIGLVGPSVLSLNIGIWALGISLLVWGTISRGMKVTTTT